MDDEGPELLITELEDITEINDILLETIDIAEVVNNVINEVEKNGKNLEEISKKRKIEEETSTVENKHFAIGIFSGSSYTPVRKQKVKEKRAKKKSQQKFTPVSKEDATQKQQRLLRLFTNTYAEDISPEGDLNFEQLSSTIAIVDMPESINKETAQNAVNIIWQIRDDETISGAVLKINCSGK